MPANQVTSQSLTPSPFSAKALMTPAVTLAQYGGYPARTKKIADTYEKDVLPVLLLQSRFAPKKASSLAVAKELQTFTHFDINFSLLPALLPQNLSLPFKWGFTYVMEGSKIGGKVIAKHLQKTLGFTERNGAVFGFASIHDYFEANGQEYAD